jgi:hypothetical protein
MGLSKDCPFVDTRIERPLPVPSCAAQALRSSVPSVRSCHLPTRSVLVVPPDFDGFLRSSAAGLSHPAADHGVRPVSDRSLPAAAAGWRPEGLLSAPRRQHPSCVTDTSVAVVVGGFRLFPLVQIRRSSRRRSALARSSPWRFHPSKVFPRTQPCLVSFELPAFPVVDLRLQRLCQALLTRLVLLAPRCLTRSIVPARSLSPLVRCLPPACPVISKQLNEALLLDPIHPGFRHRPRPQGFALRPNPLRPPASQPLSARSFLGLVFFLLCLVLEGSVRLASSIGFPREGDFAR